VLPEWSPPPTPISVVYPASSAPPLRVRVFIDFILETLAREKPWVCAT